MIHALVSGTLVGEPKQKTSAAGKQYLSIQLRVTTSQTESCLATVLCFNNSDAERLAALKKGDPVSVAGSLKPSAWVKDGEPVAGFTVMANAVLTLADAKRARAPKQKQAAPASAYAEFHGPAADLSDLGA